jgi:hypothetical protein
MDSFAAYGQRDIDSVIDEERNVVLLAFLVQFLCC